MASVPSNRQLRTLEARLDGVTDKLTTGLEKLMETIAEEIGEEVVASTPVDTGYARANWRPSVNAPLDDPVSFLDPTGRGAIGRIRTVARTAKLGDKIYIKNNAPYIETLNAGSSSQAPSGYVQIAIKRGTDIAFGLISRDGLL